MISSLASTVTGRGPTSTSKTRFRRRKPLCSAGHQRKPVPFRTAVVLMLASALGRSGTARTCQSSSVSSTPWSDELAERALGYIRAASRHFQVTGGYPPNYLINAVGFDMARCTTPNDHGANLRSKPGTRARATGTIAAAGVMITTATGTSSPSPAPAKRARLGCHKWRSRGRPRISASSTGTGRVRFDASFDQRTAFKDRLLDVQPDKFGGHCCPKQRSRKLDG